MAPEEQEDFLVRERLAALGLATLSEWDALAFIYRHGNSLTSSIQLAHFLGDDRSAISSALNRLESLGFVERSRGSQGIRLFRFSIPTDPLRSAWLIGLLKLSETRTGRLLLLKHLRRDSPQPLRRSGGLRLA